MSKTKKAASGKPTITSREASRLVAEAGAEAYANAGAQGGEPKVASALLAVGTETKVAGLQIPTMTLFTVLVLEELWRQPVYLSAVGQLKQALTLFAFLYPDKAKQLLSAGEGELLTASTEWSKQVSAADATQLSAHVIARLNEFYQVEPEPSKKNSPRP